jgi:alpha-methylacyl-CoA racemase
VTRATIAGPLAGLSVIQLAGIGPVPFAAMILADLGADVIRVDRVGAAPLIDPVFDVTARSRRALAVDLKSDAGRDLLLTLIAASDVVLEGLRPGAAERLGLGPTACRERNPQLVYGRMTGWGQDGPYARTAGHDINYLAVAGGLHPIGYADRPAVPPLNIVGDFGGGAMYLAVGVVAAVLHSRTTGLGDVVDASIVDGVASLMAMVRGWAAEGSWTDRREANILDGGAPFYGVFRCADGLDVAVGAIEPPFWATFLERMGLDGEPLMGFRDDPARWGELRERLSGHFASAPRAHWLERTAGTDACLTAVLSVSESLEDPHVRWRGTFVDVGGVTQPAPAPRFAFARERRPTPAPTHGEHTDEILGMLGCSPEKIAELRSAGIVA